MLCGAPRFPGILPAHQPFESLTANPFRTKIRQQENGAGSMMVVNPPESSVALQEMEKSPQSGFVSNIFNVIKDQTTGQAGDLTQNEPLPNVDGPGRTIEMLPLEILEQYERFF